MQCHVFKTISKAPSLALTKSLSPSTITEGDSTTVTIRVENTGGDAKSVKITDVIPQGFTLVSGAALQEYATLKATESRTFQYSIKEFSRCLEGKNFDEILHKGKKESYELMLAQGVAPVALFISKLMIEAIHQEESKHALS